MMMTTRVIELGQHQCHQSHLVLIKCKNKQSPVLFELFLASIKIDFFFFLLLAFVCLRKCYGFVKNDAFAIFGQKILPDRAVVSLKSTTYNNYCVWTICWCRMVVHF